MDRQVCAHRRAGFQGAGKRAGRSPGAAMITIWWRAATRKRRRVGAAALRGPLPALLSRRHASAGQQGRRGRHAVEAPVGPERADRHHRRHAGNDVLMFRKSGFSIAMGNASPQVQAQATVVTASYNRRGVLAKGMEGFILDRPSPVPQVTTTSAIRVFEDGETLAREAAEWLRGLALASDRRFAIRCSGGSTASAFTSVLAEPAVASVPLVGNGRHWFWARTVRAGEFIRTVKLSQHSVMPCRRVASDGTSMRS